MSTVLKVVRHQHPVGQGFFHSGHIAGPQSEFRYVYDCGAMGSYAPARKREIAAYRKSLGGSRIDALFISHAHADHVNGLPELLQGTGRVGTIFLPLIELTDRLIAFARAASEDPITAETDFYRRFTLAPIRALAEFGPRRIVQFRRSEGGVPTEEDGRLPEPDGPELRDESWRFVGRGAITVREPVSTTKASVEVMQAPDSVAVAPRVGASVEWLLAPYVDIGVTFKRNLFVKNLAQQLEMSVPKLKKWLQDGVNREILLTKHVARLASAYKAVEKDLNVTSLCLYSGLAGTGTKANLDVVFGKFHFKEGGSDRIGWLATGDAELSKTARRSAFLKHYGKHLSKVATFTLPHHGSDENFHPDLLAKIEAGFCVAASDAHSKWRHPGTATIQAVAGTGRFVSNVTSSAHSTFFEIVVVP
jgi:hypothetical protein